MLQMMDIAAQSVENMEQSILTDRSIRVFLLFDVPQLPAIPGPVIEYPSQPDVGQTEENLNANVKRQEQFNQKVSEGTAWIGRLAGPVKDLAGNMLTLNQAGKVLDMADAYTDVTSKLNAMNDGYQSTPELVNRIYDSAKETRLPFMDTADAVLKMGSDAGAAFSSNTEMIDFLTQVNKHLALGGTSAQVQSDALGQLSQAMSSGVIKGEALNSMLEAAPGMAAAIESSMGWAQGSLLSYGEKGEVTAQVVKDSLLNMAEETNAAFGQMPFTFSQAMTSLKNDAWMAFQGILEKISEIGNSTALQLFLEQAGLGIQMISDGVMKAFDFIGQFGSFLTENWSTIVPVILAVAAALAIYALISTIVAAVNGIVSTGQTIFATAAGIAAASQQGLNATLLACPLTWIIALIIAVVAAIYAVIGAINKITGSSISATGVIAGAITTAVAAIWNLFLGLLELILGVVNAIVNPFITVANFIGNVFHSPISAAIRLFESLGDNALAVLQRIASGMDFVFGGNLEEKVMGWRAELKNLADNAVEKYAPEEDYQEYISKLELTVDDLDLKRWDYQDAYEKGNHWGENLEEDMKNFDLSSLLDPDSISQDAIGQDDKLLPPIHPEDYLLPPVGAEKNNSLLPQLPIDNGLANLPMSMPPIARDVNNISNYTKTISGSMDITKEDLKYLRDVAEQEIINRFTTAEIQVAMTNHNTINKDMDLDKVSERLRFSLEEEMCAAAEGVY